MDQLINETEIVNVGGQNIGRSPWSNISHLGSAFGIDLEDTVGVYMV